MSFPTQTAADRITALFMKGNALAAKAQYREALKCYEKILGKGPRKFGRDQQSRQLSFGTRSI
jgi:hypothetical protein